MKLVSYNLYGFDLFLGAFANLRKATIFGHVGPSVRMEQLGCHWTDFHENLYLCIFRNSVEKYRASLKPYKNGGYFT